MKNCFFLVFFLLFSFASSAQLTDGSVAPDFTATDQNGIEWNLYALLDEGKVVILDYFAVWDSYAWDYYQSGALQAIYEEFGPSGSNRLVILQIESEPSNTGTQLLGPALLSQDPGTETQGDWISGNPFPLIDNSAIADLYQVNYIPTLYMICPDRFLTQIAQVDAASISAYINGAVCPVLTTGVDGMIKNLRTSAVCGTGEVTYSFTLKNLGTDPLTSVEMLVSGILNPLSIPWSGQLEPFAEQEFSFTAAVAGNTDITVAIVSEDAVSSNNTMTVASGVHKSSPSIKLRLGLDNFPSEVSWEIRNSNNEIVFSDGEFTISYQYFEHVYDLPEDDCYTFYLYDEGGDGLHGSQWGGYDGTCYLTGLNGTGDVMAEILSYDGSYNFEETQNPPSYIKVEFEALEALEIKDVQAFDEFSLYPIPTSGSTNIRLGKMDSGNLEIQVFSNAGQLVYAQNTGAYASGLKNIQCDFSFLRDGIYIVRLSDHHTAINHKLVIAGR